MTMVRVRRAVLGLCAALAVAFATMLTATTPVQANDHDATSADETGCPLGAVCVYPSLDYNGGNPTYIFWSYGVHRIYDQYGWHLVVNNQTDWAEAYLCRGANGTNCSIDVNSPREVQAYLTPVNSVLLRP